MSRVRDLPEVTSLDGNDLIYAVDVSEGPNGGRKITKDNLKTTVAQSPAEIKTAYESNADTNAFTDAEKAKLAGVEAGAAADQTASEVPYVNTVSGLSATDVQAAIDEVSLETQADFRPSIVSGRILHYTGGTARFDGVFYELIAGDILLSPNITLGEVYVDLDGLVKQTGSGVLAPPYTIVFAKFSTDLNDITYLLDERVKNAQNIVRGLLADVRDVRAGAAASEGSSGRVSDAMHKHNILTAAAVDQAPDQANAEGTSVSLARADHVHNIPTAAPVTIGTANSQGVATTFSRADHVHDHGSQAGGSLHAVATQSVAGFMSAADKVSLDLMKEAQILTNEPTGFPNRTDSTISFDAGTRTFTIQPVGASFDYWIAGIKYTISSPESVQISTDTGLHFVWFDNNGQLLSSFGQPFPDVFIEPIAFVSVLYWNNTSGEVIVFGDERHGMTMDNHSHRFVNNAFGATFNSGLALGDFSVDGDGSSNAHAQFSVADGSFFDEDIIFDIVDGSPQVLHPSAELPILYRLGASGHWYKKAANSYPIIYSGTAGYTGASGRVAFNEFNGTTWQLTEVSEGNYVWVHIIAVNDDTTSIMGIQGTAQYTAVNMARNGVEAEIANLGTLAAREQIVIGSVLFQSSSSHANIPKAIVASVLGSNYVDFRQVLVQVAGAANDHSSLANLQVDTHLQYLNRSGVRAMTGNLDMGGQSITNVNLVDGIDVTAHASRHNPGGADAIATASATGLTAASTNTEGVATSVARSDHTHSVAAGVVSTQIPDQANAEGVSVNFARADHIHNIPAAAPTTTLSPATTNDEGVGTSFARNDHTHAIATALVGDITTIQPDDTASAGAANTFARGDHRHAIAAAPAAGQTPDQANAEGASTSFARADHVHNIPTATPVATGSANSQGAAATFARADHVHNTVLNSSQATATVTDTTTSVTDTLLASMTLTPIAGTYLVRFNSSTVNSGNGAERNYFSVYVGGVQRTHTEIRVGTSGGAVSPIGVNDIVTVNGSQAVEIRWRVAAGTGSCYQRSLSVIRIG